MSKHHILIVDDEPKVAFFFQQHLAMVDDSYQAKAVNSGPAALEELQHQHYDLMITDLRMPEMDGLELLRRVKKVSPNTKTILVTAYGSDDVWEEARRLEIFRSLSKPLKIPDLLASVREVFSSSSPRPEVRKGILALTGENFEKLSVTIEALRVDVGAQTVVVADTTGRILVHAGPLDTVDLDSTLALLGGTMAASNELAQQLKYEQPQYLSHFEGPPYDLYATNLGNDFFLTIILSRHKEASRIGVVWLFTRRVLPKIVDLLGHGTTHSALEDGFAENVQSELEDLFGPNETTTIQKVLPVQPKKKQNDTSKNLSQEINSILTQFGLQTGLMVEKRLDALDQTLSPTAVNLILRTISSGLKNIHQHAQASIIGISFNIDDENLYGRIVDDGIGFDKTKRELKLGSLRNLQEAYKRFGGSLEISAYPNQGTTLAITLPLKAK